MKKYTVLFLFIVFFQSFSVNAQDLNKTNKKKISKLEKLMSKAKKKGFDITREKPLFGFLKNF